MNPLKEFLKNFNQTNPDWTNLPELFPRCDLDGLTSEEVGKFQSIVTLWELNRPQKPESRSRAWKSSGGYRFLVQWSNLVLLRILVRKFTETLPRSEYRAKAQADDAARSAAANIEEGFQRPTTGEYLNFIGFSQASLGEVRGDVERWLQDGFITSKSRDNLYSLGIDLQSWNEWARDPLNSSRILLFPLKENKGGYRTLEEIKGKDLTYEMFTELINKTDYLLRKLVESLEKKMSAEKRGYQIEQARIREKFKRNK